MALFVGFVLPPKKNESDTESGGESDSDDDFEDHDFQDMQKIAEEKMCSSSSIKLRYVVKRMQELSPANRVASATKEWRVRAQFDPSFSHPWWKVEIQTDAKKSSRAMKVASSRPSYSCRTDDAVGEDILSLFLIKGCGVEDTYAKELMEFIKRSNLRPTLVDLLNNLAKFANSGKDNGNMAEQIMKCLQSSSTGKAFHVPELAKYAHRLFPNQACSLFGGGIVGLHILQRMNESLGSEPWIFGFRKVLKNQFHISGIEAKLSGFIKCDLLSGMPVDKHDALYIYNALSEVTRRCGHTYVLLGELKQQKYYDKPYSPQSHHVTKWERALAYLKELQVVGTEGDISNDRCHVFLTHLRDYEKTIASNLSTMMMNNVSWIGHIDVEEEVFGGDGDQLEAAKLLTTKPVVVMSGRGGCGKTFVVSSILRMKAGYPLADSSGEEESDPGLLPETTDEERTANIEALQESPDLQTSLALNLQSSHRSFPDELSELHQSLSSKCHPTDPHANHESCPVSTYASQIEEEVLLTAPTGKAAALLRRRTKISAYTLHSVIFSFFSWLKWKKEENKGENEEKEAWKFSKVRLLVCDECSLISVRLFATLIDILRRNSKVQQVVLLGDIDQLPSIEAGNFLSDVYRAFEPHGASIKLTTNHRTNSAHIVQNAIKISQQRMPLFTKSDGGFVSLEYRSKQTDEDSNTIAYKVRALLKDTELPDPKRSQFVAFRNKDCTLINELCAVHYNSHSIRNEKGKFDFRIGDKVCLRRNTVCFDENKNEEIKLCNGEIFFIKDIIQEESNRSIETYFVLDDDDRTVKINLQMLKKLRHAWARTIHTFQGSEINTLVYVLGNPYYQNWQHVYTAVTRGVQKVFIINDPINLKNAIRSSPTPRKTKLLEDLSQALGSTFSWRTQVLKSVGCNKSNQSLASHEITKELTSPETQGENSFCISRKRLRERSMENKLDTSSGSTIKSVGKDDNEVSAIAPTASAAAFPDQTTMASPPKRQFLESSALLSPSGTPGTPKSLRHLKESLSAVTPFKNPSENQNSPAASNNTTPSKRRAVPAKRSGTCVVCHRDINQGEKIVALDDLVGKYRYQTKWVHEGCARN